MGRHFTILAIASCLLAAAIDFREPGASPTSPQVPTSAPQASATEAREKRAMSPSEIAGIWSRYHIARQRYEWEVYKFYDHLWLDLSATLVRLRDEQLSLIALQDLRFRWVLENDPARLTPSSEVAALADFEWNDADADSLRAANPTVVTVETFLTRTRDELATDRQLPEAQRRIVKLQSEETFLRMARRFDDFVRTLDVELSDS